MIQPAAQAPPDHDRSTAHLALQRPPKVSVLLNKVAAEASDKWKKLGQQLDIEHHKLKTISKENDDILDCFAELWKRGGSPPYTWATIIDALCQAVVPAFSTCQRLQQQLCLAKQIPLEVFAVPSVQWTYHDQEELELLVVSQDLKIRAKYTVIQP